MIKTICVILLVVAVLVFSPMLTIWALNTLFPVLAIQYNFYNWLAVVILGGLFNPYLKVN